MFQQFHGVTAEGVQSLYVYDGIGNPEALVTNQDSTTFAYDYDPYGVPALNDDNGEGDPVNPFQFKGGIHDRSTNWVKFGYRWYSVGTGRFTQRDTLDAPLDPANANRYTFAGNDPINYSDPLGLYSWAEAGSDCLQGAVMDAGISAGLGLITGGASLVGTLAGGCAISVGLGFLVDQLPEDQQPSEEGMNYIDILQKANKYGKNFL